MDGRPTWTDCDEAGDYVVPNVLSPRDLVSRPDKMDETVPHTQRMQEMVSVKVNREIQTSWLQLYVTITSVFSVDTTKKCQHRQ